MDEDVETLHTVTCSTVAGQAGNRSISFAVTIEQSYRLLNLAKGTLRKEVELSGAGETVSAGPNGLQYANIDLPGAARGSMMDRQSVIAEMERVQAEVRESAPEREK